MGDLEKGEHKGPIVEGHHSLTTCTHLPTSTARYITTSPHFLKALARKRGSGAWN